MTLPFARGVRGVYIGAVVALSHSQPAGTQAEAGASRVPQESAAVSRESSGTETVRRPDPGLARGIWEAPPVFFYAAGGVIVAVSVIYALWRRGLVRLRRTRSTSS